MRHARSGRTQTRETDHEKARGSSPDIGCHLEYRHGCDDELKWRLCKAIQQLQIPHIFVCDDGVVTARDDLVQKCLCLEVRHKPQNVEQALRQLTQRNDLNMSEACPSIAIACGHEVRKAINAAQLLAQRSSSSELPTADLSAQLPVISFCFRAMPQTCQRCLSCRSRTTSLSVERAFKPGPKRVSAEVMALGAVLSALRVTQCGLKTRPIPSRTVSILVRSRR